MEVFLFHALCACSERNTESELLHMVRNCKQKLLLKVFQLGRADEVQRLFDLEDGRGRTPLHVAVDHDAIKEFFSLKEYFQEAFWRHIVNRRDAGGRTPLHRTASSIEPPKDLTLLVKDEQTDKALTLGEGHIACYNPRGAKIMKIMKKFRRAESRSSNTYKRRTGTTDQILTPLELAASVGNTSIVRLFEMQAWEPLEEDSLCIAAATGNSQALEHIISTQQFRNSKAMYAAIGSDEKVEKKIASTGKSLLDVVNFRDGWCKMEEKWQILSDNKARADRRERQACVNLLLQAGLSTHPDVLGRYPTPGPSCSAEFCSWWSERTEREVQDTRMSLTTATNAISVTAALVATTAFIGPLQPPKGYNENYAQIHTANVRIYLFCDTLAFYLALSAIVLAMIPSLPMCSEWVKIHERRTRKTVVYAVLLLICSVFYILVAFACASVAIIPKDHFWGHAILTLSTATLGAGVFYLTMRAFYKRLKDLFLDLISPDGNQSETKLSHLIKSQYDYLKEYSSSR
ncbi:hypothetical protein MPTK1_4g07840 [Marchantia polymorpha subsp. ruderalis]|uniref:PGG domain-containing protein n=2 Tax=Marchantia polymorpha TaxID=3197 RepID=A0AAF6B7J9_MARPO|nr:hypothetical protein MARPO_0120s0057 [Marchantia polymorpha]BBN07983.1 hypothetical protein Mp_4g07840 [Marchantia polymorpha subsp. ruderalis]|eukprot:PTQ30787.1 hypothetical protein MARPO_0120s0057 [Marchantia polymorpha]